MVASSPPIMVASRPAPKFSRFPGPAWPGSDALSWSAGIDVARDLAPALLGQEGERGWPGARLGRDRFPELGLHRPLIDVGARFGGRSFLGRWSLGRKRAALTSILMGGANSAAGHDAQRGANAST